MSEAYFPVESGALGPEENFLSLDDILMSHEKLPARTETLLPRLGGLFLERSSSGGSGGESEPGIPEGSKLEIPLWLAKGLYDNKRRILSVELPKIYKEGWRTVFSADANVVDLHKMGPHYYAFGSQLLHFDSPENPDVSLSLLQFLPRFCVCYCCLSLSSGKNTYEQSYHFGVISKPGESFPFQPFRDQPQCNENYQLQENKKTTHTISFKIRAQRLSKAGVTGKPEKIFSSAFSLQSLFWA